MSNTYLGGCELFGRKYGLEFRCCGSCHYDHEEHDYNMCVHKDEDGYYEVCCNAIQALEENRAKPKAPVFELLLRTSDGFTRTDTWKGSPPREYKTMKIKNPGSFKALQEGIPESKVEHKVFKLMNIQGLRAMYVEEG